MMPNLLFGDNQFFGINHMSEEKARAQALQFQDIKEVFKTLDAAYDEGIKTFMCTTHDRVEEICNYVRANPSRYHDYAFYPCMPYAHKYANAATEEGVIGAIKKFAPESGAWTAAVRSGVSLAGKDISGITRLLIDSEMKMFKGLRTPVIFLQNVVVDLLLGLGMTEPFAVFSDHVRAKYNAEPGFITMNMPLLLDVLDELKIDNPIVCSNINKLGFRMCGGLGAYEEALRERKFRAIAMSVFASGAIPPGEAISWVCAQPNVEAIVFGASSRSNIRSTKGLVDQFWKGGNTVLA
jgi:hypothetical protein